MEGRIRDIHQVEGGDATTSSEGMEDNWVQTAPGKGWNMLFRLYSPLKPWFDKTWRPGDAEPVN